MQLDTQKKKIVVIAVAAGLVLLGGIATVYAIKQQAMSSAAQQQIEESAANTRRITAAADAEKSADKLFVDGDIAGAKTKYQAAAILYAQTKDTQGEERVKMQLSFIDSRQKDTSPETTDLSNAPIDRKLDAQLGVPAPVAQP